MSERSFQLPLLDILQQDNGIETLVKQGRTPIFYELDDCCLFILPPEGYNPESILVNDPEGIRCYICPDDQVGEILESTIIDKPTSFQLLSRQQAAQNEISL